MTAFYNEIDPYAAAWLRNLIAAGHIASGVVDERSIVELDPDELRGYTQCHFFAGIGVWSRALRLAGWPDDRPVWTGSCPCQPFSAAGKGKGHEDERHLWPTWQRLIRECSPPAVFGEQVASADGLGWLDVVLSDMEAAGYAVAAADLSAAGYGAPHIRQRLFFVAHAERRTAKRHGLALGRTAGGSEGANRERERVRDDARHGVVAGLMADTEGRRLGQGSADAPGSDEGARAQGAGLGPADDGGGGLGDAWGGRRSGSESVLANLGGPARGERSEQATGAPRSMSAGFWDACDWIPCRDGKARPVEPGTFPLAHGATSRVGRLRGYGNAICAPVAQGFIEAAVAAIGEQQ